MSAALVGLWLTATDTQVICPSWHLPKLNLEDLRRNWARKCRAERAADAALTAEASK